MKDFVHNNLGPSHDLADGVDQEHVSRGCR